MIELRPYQERGVAEIRQAFAAGKRRVLFCLPTGGGKTTVFSYVTRATAERGKRVCVLVHRQELVDQVSASLARMSVPHGIIAAGQPETGDAVQVASVASLVRRLDRVAPFDLIVPDEAHHAIAGSWERVIASMPQAFVLGVTATPERLDGRGLGDCFDHMVQGPSVADLTRAGFLVPSIVYAPPQGVDLSAVKTRAGDFASDQAAGIMSGAAVVGNAVEHYKRLASGKPAICFCVDIAHSQLVAARFREAGIRAAHVDGTTDPAERRALMAALGSGELEVLTNASLISEGVDIPAIGAAILLRPTQSLGLHLQQVGRALRPAPGKDRAIILDHAGNSARLGFPDDERTWSLEEKPRRTRGASEAPLFRECEECGARNRCGADACQACGAALKAGPREVAVIEAQLVEAERVSTETKLRAMSYRDAIRWADTADKLRQVAKARRYHHGWVRRMLADGPNGHGTAHAAGHC